MENGILVALSRQTTLQRHLAVIAHNIANADTPGFKRIELMLQDHALPTPLPTRRGDAAVFVRDVATVRDTRDGRLEMTGNPLDVALRGEGYFVVDTGSGQRLTRDGHFRLDETGQLVTSEGHAVLGQGDRPIVLTRADTRISISRDGTLSSELGPIGRLRIVRLADEGSAELTGGDLLQASAAVEDVGDPIVAQGMIERSNVEPILELEEMIRVHRAYEQTSHFLTREDERIRKVIDTYVI
jgi:flagellar basal-body rod protein FlgF